MKYLQSPWYYSCYVLLAIIVACKEEKKPQTPVTLMEKPQTHNAQNASDLQNKFNDVIITNDTLIEVKNWKALTAFKPQDVKTPQLNSLDAYHAVQANFEALKAQTPAYLSIDHVQDAIEDLEKALVSYEYSLTTRPVNETYKELQINTIKKAHNHLKTAILQAQKKYSDPSTATLKSYLKELNDYDTRKTGPFTRK